MTNYNDPKIGLVLNNGTVVQAPLASGGMGTVYTGVDRLGRKVVIKFMYCDAARGTRTFELFRHNFFREAQIMAGLEDCPAFPIIYDIDQEHEAIVMEFIRGTPLDEMIARMGGPIPSRDLRKYLLALSDIAESLARAHSRIVHRDIKPVNFHEEPEERGVKRLRLLDMGISREYKPDDSDMTISGTPEYMPPEQYTGEPVTRQADQYALGCVLYELFTGEKFIQTDVSRPEEILYLHVNDQYRAQRFSIIKSYRRRALVELMMAKNPRDRLVGMLEVMGALKLLEYQLEIEEEHQIAMRDLLEEMVEIVKLNAAKRFGGQWEIQGALKLLIRQAQLRQGKPATVTVPVPQEMLVAPELHSPDSAQDIPVEVAVEGSPGPHPLMGDPTEITPDQAAEQVVYSDEEVPDLRSKRYLWWAIPLFIGTILAMGFYFWVWFYKGRTPTQKSSKSTVNKPAMTLPTKPTMKPEPMRPVIIKARRRADPVVVRIPPRTTSKPQKHPYDVLLGRCRKEFTGCRFVLDRERWIRNEAKKLQDPCVALKVFLKMREIYVPAFIVKDGKRVWNENYVGKKQKWGIIWNIMGHGYKPGRGVYKGYTARCEEHKRAPKSHK